MSLISENIVNELSNIQAFIIKVFLGKKAGG